MCHPPPPRQDRVKNERTTRQNFTIEKKGKCIFCGVFPVMRLWHLNVQWVIFWSIQERDQVSQTIELWQAICNRSNLTRRTAESNLFDSWTLEEIRHYRFIYEIFSLKESFWREFIWACNNINYNKLIIIIKNLIFVLRGFHTEMLTLA